MRARGRGRWTVAPSAALAAALGVLAGCELEEITVAETEDVVVAEVYLQLDQGFVGAPSLMGFLHRTVGGLGAGYHPVPGARIIVRRQDGFSVELAETEVERCARTLPVDGTGSCYRAAAELAGRFRPGDRLELEVLLSDGGVLRSATTVPGGFDLRGLEGRFVCELPPDTPWEMRWSASEGAWAYIAETRIVGLADALAPAGIPVDDPLYLLGLSVSAADTTIVFPGEFGVFNRFELDRELAARLQEGLPPGTAGADVSITAADRNYVNWVRGGNFNPSGRVRVPSVRGDGTGVFAATVLRPLKVWMADAPGEDDAPACALR